MRFAQVISHYVPAYRFGGPQQVAHGLGRALVRAGHQVQVFTTNLADERQNLNVPLDQPVDVEGVQVFYEPTVFSRYWGYAPGLKRRLRKELPSADHVLVHFHFQYANFIGARLARALDRRYSLFAHGSFKRDAIERKGTWKKRLYLNTLERPNLQAAERIVFNAEEERDGSLEFPQGCLLPNGLEPADYHPLPLPGTFRDGRGEFAGKTLILFLGRLDFQGKGLDLLLPAFADLVRGGTRAHLLLAGPDERGGEQAARQLVQQLQISSHVTFLGMISGDMKLAVLRDADCMVLPSRSEGLSITVLEALYLGIPLLVTDQVGLHQRVTDLRAGVVTRVSPEDVARGLRELIEPDQLARMRGAASKWIAANFTWDAIATTFLSMISR